MQASQDRKGTALSWQARLPQGLALLPGCPALAEWIDPEVKQESPSLGLGCLCPRLPRGPETLGCWALRTGRGSCSWSACAHALLLWGPWPPACLTISPPLRAGRQSQVRQLLLWAQAGPGPQLPPSSRPLPSRPSQKAPCALPQKAASPRPAGGVRRSDGGPKRPGGRSAGRAGQEEREVRCRHSQTRQGVCAVSAFRAGESMWDGGSEVANLVGQPTRAALP